MLENDNENRVAEIKQSPINVSLFHQQNEESVSLHRFKYDLFNVMKTKSKNIILYRK